jgi:hypothetical protein
VRVVFIHLDEKSLAGKASASRDKAPPARNGTTASCTKIARRLRSPQRDGHKRPAQLYGLTGSEVHVLLEMAQRSPRLTLRKHWIRALATESFMMIP